MDRSSSHRPVPHQAVKSLENMFPNSALGKLPSLLNFIRARIRREEGGRVKQKLRKAVGRKQQLKKERTKATKAAFSGTF